MANNTGVSRLKSKIDFDALRETKPILTSDTWLMLSYKKNDGKGFRVGWTLPGYVGTSVIRNRLKRWLRVFFSQYDGSILKSDCDVNIVFRRRSGSFYNQLEHKELDVALKKLLAVLARKI